MLAFTPFSKTSLTLRQAMGFVRKPCSDAFAFLISLASESLLDRAGDPFGDCGGKYESTLLSSSMHWKLCPQPYSRHFTTEMQSYPQTQHGKN